MIWKNRYIAGLWDVSKYANDENGLRRAYNGIIKIFEGCDSYEDFYYRMKEFVVPAKYVGSIFFTRSIEKIAKKSLLSIKSRKKIKLWCFQEAILMVAGIKGIYSQWEGNEKRFVTDHEFDFRFWVGRKERNHVEMVIHKWKGKRLDISMDVHLEEEPYKWNNEARYLNSVMKSIEV